MTDQKIETVQSAYAAFGRGDIPAALATMAFDVEFVESEARGIPTRGTHIGPQQVAENVFSAIPQVWQEFALARKTSSLTAIRSSSGDGSRRWLRRPAGRWTLRLCTCSPSRTGESSG